MFDMGIQSIDTDNGREKPSRFFPTGILFWKWLGRPFHRKTSRRDFKEIPYSFFLKKKYVRAGAHVVVSGFPMGRRSQEYATPILRRGMVAIANDFEFMIDPPIYPGNSGGPVIYAPTVKFDTTLFTINTVDKDRIIGFVSSVVPYIDSAVSPQTGRTRITFEEFSGLCNVVPSDAILGLLESHAVKEVDNLVGRRDKLND